MTVRVTANSTLLWFPDNNLFISTMFLKWPLCVLFALGMGVMLASPVTANADGLPSSSFLWTPPNPAYKILVDSTGLYQLHSADLTAAGVPVNGIDPRTFQLFNGGKEVAIQVTGESDGSFDAEDVILFFGQAADTRYTGANVYWLTYGVIQGKRMQPQTGPAAAGERMTGYPAVVHQEINQIYISALPLAEGHDHWYGPPIQVAGNGNVGRREFDIPLDAVKRQAGDAVLVALFAGNTTGNHHLRLFANDHLVYEGQWQGRSLHTINARFPQVFLYDGQNHFRAELVNDTPGQPFDMVYTDWLTLHYVRGFVARNDSLSFDITVNRPVEIMMGGFGESDVQVFDVTDPSAVHPVSSVWTFPHFAFFDSSALQCTDGLPSWLDNVQNMGGPSNSLPGRFVGQFGVMTPGLHRYLALTTSQILAPSAIFHDIPSFLRSPDNGADYILITHHDFLKAAQILADYRASQGMRVAVVDVQDIYDEFNGGLMSAEAIRDFLAYAHEHWIAPAPRFVLLMGDGTYDMRHYLPDTATTYIPPYLAFIDTLLGEAASDNRYVAFIGDDNLPDMAIGRMPANTLDEAMRMVNKTISYETHPKPGGWNHNVLFVADDPAGGAGSFYELSDELAEGAVEQNGKRLKLLPAPYKAIKIYAGITCQQSVGDTSRPCTRQIVHTLENPGALILNYIGHATRDYWAAERLLDQSELDALDTEGQWPITLAMSCVDGFFHQPRIGAQSFAEANVRTAGGSVASWSATSLGLAKPHQWLEKGLFLALFHENIQTLGEATTWAKYYLAAHAPAGAHYSEPIDAYILFGDPALRVHFVP